MPSFWLLKTEPSAYSFEDLEREGQTVWDGVTNNLARKHLRSFQPGDRVLFYHTGDEKQVVGLARVVSPPYPDPTPGRDHLLVVDLQPEQRLPSPVSLATIKQQRTFQDSDVVRLPRLSVIPITEDQWSEILQLGGV
jgi:predicted RNA-binding protein with PUA-like domain